MKNYYKNLKYFIAGVLFIGAVFSVIVNSVKLMSVSMSLIMTIVTGGAYFTIYYLIKKKKIGLEVGNSGIRIKSLGIKYHLFVLGIIFCFWFPHFISNSITVTNDEVLEELVALKQSMRSSSQNDFEQEAVRQTGMKWNELKHLIHSTIELSESYVNLGYSYYILDSLDKAKESFQKSITFNKNNLISHNNLAFLHLLQGDYRSALAEYEFVLEIEKESYQGLLNIGKTALLLNMNDYAEKRLLQAIDIVPTDYHPFELLAFSKYEVGDIQSSYEYYEKVVELNPSNKNALGKLCVNFLKYYPNQNIKHCLNYLEVHTDDFLVLHAIGYYYMETAQDYVKAIEYYNKAQVLNNNDASLYYNMAISFLNVREFGFAINCINRAISIEGEKEEYLKLKLAAQDQSREI